MGVILKPARFTAVSTLPPHLNASGVARRRLRELSTRSSDFAGPTYAVDFAGGDMRVACDG
jgi:hypothetical protein